MHQIFVAISALAPIWLFIETRGIHEDYPRSWPTIRLDLFILGAGVAVFLCAQWLFGFLGGAVFLLPIAIIAKVTFIDISKPAPRSCHQSAQGQPTCIP